MMKHFWLNSYCKALVATMLLIVTSAVSAEITLTLDRTDIHEHETFHLRVQVEESNTLNEGANADFIPEEITVRSRQEYNSSVIVNGQYNTKMGWDFELLAEEAGTYTIPALSISNERSEPFTIRVLPEQDDLGNAENSKIKLRASISDEEVYVQQQLIFTVRIYRSVVARSQKITPIRVTNALVEQLGDNKSFDVVKNGNNFRVVEQRYAIFPQQSGDMVIEPMTYSATILEEGSSRSPWQRSQLKPVSLSTQKYTVTVKPKPQNAAEPWLPATKLDLEAEWQPKNQTFTVGDPANMDFIIKGTGLLKTQLPTVTFPQQNNVTIYRDTPQYRQRFNRFGVNSYHFEKIVVIPSTSGDITLPEVKIPWWNVKTDQQEYAVLPAQTIRVEPSNKQINNNNNSQAVISDAQKAAMQPEPSGSTVDADISVTNTTTSTWDYWKYISLTLAILWLLTLWLWFRNKQKVAQTTTAPNRNAATQSSQGDATNHSLKQVISSAKKQQAEATAQNLSAWLKQQKVEPKVSTLNQFYELCHQNGQDELVHELAELQKHLYSDHTNRDWQGKKLAKLLEQFEWPKGNSRHDKLPELYDKDI